MTAARPEDAPSHPSQPVADIGVIGGSGFYEFLTDAEEVRVETPFGEPSEAVLVGEVEGRRHHHLAEHDVVTEEDLMAGPHQEHVMKRGAGHAHPDAGQRPAAHGARRGRVTRGEVQPVAFALPGIRG